MRHHKLLHNLRFNPGTAPGNTSSHFRGHRTALLPVRPFQPGHVILPRTLRSIPPLPLPIARSTFRSTILIHFRILLVLLHETRRDGRRSSLLLGIRIRGSVLHILPIHIPLLLLVHLCITLRNCIGSVRSSIRGDCDIVVFHWSKHVFLRFFLLSHRFGSLFGARGTFGRHQ